MRLTRLHYSWNQRRALVRDIEVSGQYIKNRMIVIKIGHSEGARLDEIRCRSVIRNKQPLVTQ